MKIVNAIYFVIKIDSKWHAVQTFVADATTKTPRMIGVAHGLKNLKIQKRLSFTMLELDMDQILFSLITIYVNDILPFPLLDVHRLHISRMFVGNQNTETKNSIAKNRE